MVLRQQGVSAPVERRHKPLSFLGMAGEERHKALLVLVFNAAGGGLVG